MYQKIYGNAVTANQDGWLRTVSAQQWRDEVDFFGGQTVSLAKL